MRSAIALILVLATGCAHMQYNQAMRQGARAERKGDYEAAMQAYERARAENPDGEGDEAYRAALQGLVALTLEEAKGALGAGRYEESYEKLDAVQRLDDDQIEVFEMRRELERTMSERANGLFEVGDADGAYALAVRLRTLFPEAAALPPLIAGLRTHFIRTADEQRKAGEYALAMKAIEMVREIDPEAEEMFASVDQSVRRSWAEELGQSGQALLKQQKYDEALLRFAHAYSLAGREDHQAGAREAAEGLRPLGLFKVAFEVGGAQERQGVFEQTLREAHDTIPELILSEPADLTLSLNLPEPRCDEVAARTPKTVEYLADRVEIENPDRLQVEAEIAEADQAIEAADSKANALWPRVEALQREVAEAARALDAAEAERATVLRQEQMTRTQLDAARRTIGEGSVDTDSVIKHVREWEAAYEAARAERERADGVRDQAEAARKETQTQLEAVQGDYQRAMQERDAQTQRRKEKMGELRHLPRTVMQDVHDTLAYHIEEWTRTCRARVEATVQTTWPTALPSTDRYSTSRETQDTANIGHEKAGVQEDPKAYPLSDADLVADADAESAEALLGWLGRLADERYAVMRAEVLQAPLTAEALGMYIAAPARVDGEVRRVVAEAAGEEGIGDLDEVLGITW